MGIILNPKADNDSENPFLKICKNRINGMFVDKTDFICETIDRFGMDNNLIAFPSPGASEKPSPLRCSPAIIQKAPTAKMCFRG